MAEYTMTSFRGMNWVIDSSLHDNAGNHCVFAFDCDFSSGVLRAGSKPVKLVESTYSFFDDNGYAFFNDHCFFYSGDIATRVFSSQFYYFYIVSGKLHIGVSSSGVLSNVELESFLKFDGQKSFIHGSDRPAYLPNSGLLNGFGYKWEVRDASFFYSVSRAFPSISAASSMVLESPAQAVNNNDSSFLTKTPPVVLVGSLTSGEFLLNYDSSVLSAILNPSVLVTVDMFRGLPVATNSPLIPAVSSALISSLVPQTAPVFSVSGGALLVVPQVDSKTETVYYGSTGYNGNRLYTSAYSSSYGIVFHEVPDGFSFSFDFSFLDVFRTNRLPAFDYNLTYGGFSEFTFGDSVPGGFSVVPIAECENSSGFRCAVFAVFMHAFYKSSAVSDGYFTGEIDNKHSPSRFRLFAVIYPKLTDGSISGYNNWCTHASSSLIFAPTYNTLPKFARWDQRPDPGVVSSYGNLMSSYTGGYLISPNTVFKCVVSMKFGTSTSDVFQSKVNFFGYSVERGQFFSIGTASSFNVAAPVKTDTVSATGLYCVPSLDYKMSFPLSSSSDNTPFAVDIFRINSLGYPDGPVHSIGTTILSKYNFDIMGGTSSSNPVFPSVRNSVAMIPCFGLSNCGLAYYETRVWNSFNPSYNGHSDVFDTSLLYDLDNDRRYESTPTFISPYTEVFLYPSLDFSGFSMSGDPVTDDIPDNYYTAFYPVYGGAGISASGVNVLTDLYTTSLSAIFFYNAQYRVIEKVSAGLSLDVRELSSGQPYTGFFLDANGVYQSYIFPPVFAGLSESIYLGSLFGWNGSTLYWSEPLLYNLWSSLFTYVFPAEILSVTVFQNFLYVFTAEGVYFSSSNSIESLVFQKISDVVIISPKSFSLSDFGVLALTYTGLYSISSRAVEKLFADVIPDWMFLSGFDGFITYFSGKIYFSLAGNNLFVLETATRNLSLVSLNGETGIGRTISRLASFSSVYAITKDSWTPFENSPYYSAVFLLNSGTVSSVFGSVFRGIEFSAASFFSPGLCEVSGSGSPYISVFSSEYWVGGSHSFSLLEPYSVNGVYAPRKYFFYPSLNSYGHNPYNNYLLSNSALFTLGFFMRPWVDDPAQAYTYRPPFYSAADNQCLINSELIFNAPVRHTVIQDLRTVYLGDYLFSYELVFRGIPGIAGAPLETFYFETPGAGMFYPFYSQLNTSANGYEFPSYFDLEYPGCNYIHFCFSSDDKNSRYITYFDDCVFDVWVFSYGGLQASYWESDHLSEYAEPELAPSNVYIPRFFCMLHPRLGVPVFLKYIYPYMKISMILSSGTRDYLYKELNTLLADHPPFDSVGNINPGWVFIAPPKSSLQLDLSKDYGSYFGLPYDKVVSDYVFQVRGDRLIRSIKFTGEE